MHARELLDWFLTGSTTQAKEGDTVVIPFGAPVPPEDIGPSPYMGFVLDHPENRATFVVGQIIVDQAEAFTMEPEHAYRLLAEELIGRGMACLVIPRDQFEREWTLSTDIPTCPASDFTRVAEYLVKTARHDPPLASVQLRHEERSFAVVAAYGEIRGIMED